jgi:hypothetical protein
MVKKASLIFLLFFTFSLWAQLSVQERTAETMVLAGEAQRKGDWVGVIKAARFLLHWGEKAYVKKCLEMAEPLVIAKYSPAGALQMAGIYKKMKNFPKERYWMDIYFRFKAREKRIWQKK